MPDLVFNIGCDEVPFVLKPHDYISKQPQWDRNDIYVVEISIQWEPEGDTKYIVLGSAFLARCYNVFIVMPRFLGSNT